MKHFRHAVLWLMVVLLPVVALVPTAHALPNQEDLNNAILSTVLVYTPMGQQGGSTGSGSIVDARGLILTNFHVVGDVQSGQLYNEGGWAAIAVTRNPRQPAVPLFWAQVVRGDPNLDLALLRVAEDIDENPLRGCLTLPTYEVGDSDQVDIGEELAIIGFPGIGGNSVTFTAGRVSGFESDPNSDVVALIKTDAEINPGNSGGSAVADDGSLIGVPTYTSEGQQGRQGKLGLVRPINLSEEVLASLPSVGVPGCSGGSTNTPPPQTPQTPSTPNTEGAVAMLGFNLDPDEEDFIASAPGGITELYGHFSYSDIDASTPLAAQWFRDGQAIPETELFFEEWPLDPGDGFAYISTEDRDGLIPGTYTLEVQVGDLAPIGGEIVVGGGGNAAPPSPDATEVIIRGRIISADNGKPIRNAYFAIFQPGVTIDTFEGEDQVYDVAYADARGVFQMSLPIDVDTPYSILVSYQGYLPIAIDGFVARDYYEGGSFLDLGDLALKRQ